MKPRRHAPAPVLLMTVADKLPDGSVHARSWVLPRADAERIAGQLGQPYRESITPSATAQAGARWLQAAPGYLEYHHHGNGHGLA